ncbi:MAG TPA: uroporphyrinogen-III synthase [Chromatiales bacterium]|nr:uroporphyrinogen-III synthase [Thiotrichales bacterium]HIP68390.1 uroporphyrinogen-III synthase [Chromatiales bacterium]
MNDDCLLNDLAVLVTRPQHQATHFCQLIEAAGGRAVRFPVIEIADIEDRAKLQQQIEQLERYDYAIFISPNAADKAIENIIGQRNFPQQVKRVAIGRKTAQKMQELGYPAEIFPEDGYNSEALLTLAEMQQVTGKKIMIFRGGSGRKLLGDTLQLRGAEVEYAEVYRRVKPAPTERLGSLLEKVDVVAVTSNEGLQNLYSMADKVARMQLRKKPLLVGSRRVVELASKLEFNTAIIEAGNPSDSGMLDALCQWVQSGEHKSVRKQ